MTDTLALRNKMDKSGYKMRFIAGKVGLSYQGLLNKMNNYSEFKVNEIKLLCELLDIKDVERDAIFFA